jgi:uroporphyrinogen decarboxylase
MNHRERVLCALEYKEPDRIPIDMGSYPGASSINARAYQNLLKYLKIEKEVEVSNLLMFTGEVHDEILDMFGIDTKSVRPSIPIEKHDAPKEYFDKRWKVLWKRSSDFTYAPVDGPFYSISKPTLNDLKKCDWPTPNEIENPSDWEKKAKRIRETSDRALVARLPVGICQQAQFLRGMEGWAMDFILNPHFSDALHNRLADTWIETSTNMIQAIGNNVDILIFGDDLANTQDRPIIRPEMFRERIKPIMKRMIKSIKNITKAKIALHSCGSVYEIIEDFIDIGIDILNPLQSNAANMEPEKLKEKAGENLVLWGGIDTHFLLPKGSHEEVKDEVKRRISILGDGGGYILAPDHNVLIDIPPDNLIAMFEAANEYGVY